MMSCAESHVLRLIWGKDYLHLVTLSVNVCIQFWHTLLNAILKASQKLATSWPRPNQVSLKFYIRANATTWRMSCMWRLPPDIQPQQIVSVETEKKGKHGVESQQIYLVSKHRKKAKPWHNSMIFLSSLSTLAIRISCATRSMVTDYVLFPITSNNMATAMVACSQQLIFLKGNTDTNAIFPPLNAHLKKKCSP